MSRNKIAIIGATGNVGQMVVTKILSQQLVPKENLLLVASSNSIGCNIKIYNQTFTVIDFDSITTINLYCAIIALPTAEAVLARNKLLSNCQYIIDSSSAHRMHSDTKLIVPPVNGSNIVKQQQLYATANCIASPLTIVLNQLQQVAPIKRVVASTYQSVSGAGKAAVAELIASSNAQCNHKIYKNTYFKDNIAFNNIPQIDVINHIDNNLLGSSLEEIKIIQETQSILDNKLPIAVTAIRVPTVNCHSISLNISFSEKITIQNINKQLNSCPNIKLATDNKYYTPLDAINSDLVFCSRLRADFSQKNSVWIWLCSDNIHRGAASDIVELLVQLLTFS